MPNIVYVLTNAAMPGIVKIGMTERPYVQQRMNELYSTGVPLPFECVIARRIDDREASEIETALHTAFGPDRVNPSREFFEIDIERVRAILQVMPGEDVTPGGNEQTSEQSTDREAASEFKKRQARTNEQEFLDSLDENGTYVYERVLALGKQDAMRITWGKKGFSLSALLGSEAVVVCYAYPPGTYHQSMYTDFAMLERKTDIPASGVDLLRQHAQDIGFFVPVGIGKELRCRLDRKFGETEVEMLVGWLQEVAECIRQSEPEKSSDQEYQD